MAGQRAVQKWLLDHVRAVRNLPPRTMIAIFKGTLAFMVLEVMFMSTKIRGAWTYPVTLTSATVVVIAGFPGFNYGQTTVAAALALVGVGLGAGCFAILAKLAHARVAQGIVFTIFVYFFSYLKSKSMMFFGLALLGILVTFAGLYTSLGLPGELFIPKYLEDYLKAYTLGGGIVLFINWFILPISSERELRQTMVMSLGHVKTFAHLIAKSYALTISEEEREARDSLAQSIRADFGILQQKLQTTMLEINWSKFSVADYMSMINATQKLQQDLIGLYSSIRQTERAGQAGEDLDLFKSKFLPSSQANFAVLRREIGITIREICKVLGDGITVQSLPEYDDYREPESGTSSSEDLAPMSPRGRMQRRLTDSVADASDRKGIRGRLDQEIGLAPTPLRGRSPSPTGMRSAAPSVSEDQSHSGTAATEDPSLQKRSSPQGADVLQNVDPSGDVNGFRGKTRCTQTLMRAHHKFRESQQEILTDLLASGEMRAVDDEVRVERPQRALNEVWSTLRERRDRARIEDRYRRRNRLQQGSSAHLDAPAEAKNGQSSPSEKSQGQKESIDQVIDGLLRSGEDEDLKGHEKLLLSVTSFIFLTGQFVRDLSALHDHVVGDIAPRKKKSLHCHFVEMRTATKKKQMAAAAQHDKGHSLEMYEALAILEGRTPVKPKPTTFVTYLKKIESFFRSDLSLQALKTTAAAVVFATILMAPSSRSFFVSYGLTGGVISVVVAMSPSIARQTLFTFFNQIIGTVSGSIYGMVLLYIFRNVGGYKYNPYGIVCMMLPFAIIMMYLVYTRPPYFPLGLLALNSANVLIFTFVVYERTPTFRDSPALRAGKQLVSMCIALSIAFLFQYLINRAPARKLLRQATANLMTSMLGYYVLLSAYNSSLTVEPETVDGKRPPKQVVNLVNAELAKRERDIQGQLIALFPLLNFAKLEPDFEGPLKQELYKKIIVNTQLLLDRTRESRVMITSAAENFENGEGQEALPLLNMLSPYRRFHGRLMKHRLYILSTALQSKMPLPQDSLSNRSVPTGTIQHDALVATTRLVKQEGGREVVNSLSFLEVWSYLLSVASTRQHVDAIEEAVGDLIGVLEDDHCL